MYLRGESAIWPGHFGGLAVLEGKALLDDAGRLRLGEIRDRLDRRVARIPQLRRRVLFSGLLRGRPLWVDDDRFAIEDHVDERAVPSPGDDVQLLETAAQVYESLLDRRRPLWELWFLTGLGDGRVGALLKLHHALADGQAAVAIMGSLFDFEPDAPDPALEPWTPEPIPSGWSLLADSLTTKIRTAASWARALAHPRELLRRGRIFAQVARKSLGVEGAPRTSLNRRVGAGRRVRFLRLDLATMKEVAHAHGGKVNDVVLALWSGGLRELLLYRGEPVAGVELTTGQPVSTRSAADATIDNQVGTVVLPLPVWEADVGRRLDLMVGTTQKVKARQRPAAIMGVLVGLTATPVGRYFMLHQRATNVLVTNVIGPPLPVYVLGARILDILPIIDLEGNIGVTLCALSYAGRVFLVVTADAAGFPDLDVLMAGMEREWDDLTGGALPARTPVATTQDGKS
jgi:WS/DGAT/MGAT family acyltransferase